MNPLTVLCCFLKWTIIDEQKKYNWFYAKRPVWNENNNKRYFIWAVFLYTCFTYSILASPFLTPINKIRQLEQDTLSYIVNINVQLALKRFFRSYQFPICYIGKKFWITRSAVPKKLCRNRNKKYSDDLFLINSRFTNYFFSTQIQLLIDWIKKSWSEKEINDGDCNTSSVGSLPFNVSRSVGHSLADI